MREDVLWWSHKRNLFLFIYVLLNIIAFPESRLRSRGARVALQLGPNSGLQARPRTLRQRPPNRRLPELQHTFEAIHRDCVHLPPFSTLRTALLMTHSNRYSSSLNVKPEPSNPNIRQSPIFIILASNKCPYHALASFAVHTVMEAPVTPHGILIMRR